MGFDLETLIILAVLAFILFGPEKLPEYAATLGKFVAKMRQATSEVTKEYQNSFQSTLQSPTESRPKRVPGSICPQCHQPVTLDFAFCPECGHRLKEDQYPPQPSEPEQAELPPTPEPGQVGHPLIRALNDEDFDRARGIINQAALAYQWVIPADCWHDPYMSEEELRAEIAAGVNFLAYEDEGRLLGVMGRQDLVRVTLIRHAYVDPEAQRRGVGARLLNEIMQQVTGPVLVGTWAAAWWAIRFYERHGFRLVTQEEKDRLLNTYWTIWPRQVETSVVLADPKWFALRIYPR